MKTDDLEQKLQRQEFRRIPSEWRDEILSAATKSRSKSAVVESRPNWLVSLLWPHPKAWAALAAVWLMIFTMNHLAADETTTMSKSSSPPSPELILVLREQRRELARLVEPPPVSIDADRPRSNQPRPRSSLVAPTPIV